MSKQANAPIITLTTDFGLGGPYVAAMKGVLLSRAPSATLIDISHTIPAQDISAGSYVLASACPHYPPRTIHLAVVDPGVGTARRLLAAQLDDQWLVLPDNGLITQVLDGRSTSRFWSLESPTIRRANVSNTFHGRDVLAPAAAFLAEGGNPDDLGPQISDPILLPSPPVAASHTEVTGSVIYVDPYGNLITNIRPHHLLAPLDDWQVEVGSLSIDRISLTYGANAPGEVVGLFGSDNRLEIAVVCGSAEGRLGVGAGASVRLCRRQEAVS